MNHLTVLALAAMLAKNEGHTPVPAHPLPRTPNPNNRAERRRQLREQRKRLK